MKTAGINSADSAPTPIAIGDAYSSPFYSQDAACAAAIDWLQMQELIFRVDGEHGNAKMAGSVAKLIETMRVNSKPKQ